MEQDFFVGYHNFAGKQRVLTRGIGDVVVSIALRNQFAKVGTEFFNAGNQVVIRLMTPLKMSYEESYAKAFPFDKMVPDMLDPEMVEDTAKIVNEAIKDKVQNNLIINNRAGGNAP